MRVWAFKVKEGALFGRFYVLREFKIYIDWFPTHSEKYKWRATTHIFGINENSTGNTLAEAVANIYAVISENYGTIPDYQKAFRSLGMMTHRL